MKYKSWTKADQERLVMLYPRARWSEILAALPGHSINAIRVEARLLGARRERLPRHRRTSGVSPGREALRRYLDRFGATDPLAIFSGASDGVRVPTPGRAA